MKKLLGTKIYNGNEYRFYSSSFYDYCDDKNCYFGHVVNQEGIEVYSEGNEYYSPWTFEELIKSYEEYLKMKMNYTMKTITKKLIDSPFAKGKCYQYRIEIDNNGKKARFTYHDSVCNYEFKKELDYKDALYCFMLDARAYSETEDILDFCLQFGYINDIKRCRESYKICEENYYKLNSIFNESELREIEKEMEELGY